jgi:AcrR family transcriptional regulator
VPRRGLDTGQVVDEAARIADADGVGAVTLARVAETLGVRAPSLYNHVDGHGGLMRLLSLRSLAELTEVVRDAAVGRSGEDALAAIAHAYRAYATSHPGRYATTVRAPDPGDDQLIALATRTVSVIVAVLAAWGLQGDDAIHEVRLVRSALHGFATIEAEGGFGIPLDLDQSFELLIATLIAGLNATTRARERTTT